MSVPKSGGNYTEIGSSGLLAYGGYLSEDRPKDGQADWTSIYISMRDNSAIIGAMFHAFETMVRGVEWDMQPADETPAAQEAEAFVWQCIEDMEHGWADVLSEILTMLPFGWAYMEQVYKRRSGYNDVPALSSKYDDGKIGWSKWALRSQETRLRWEFGEHGEILGMWQQAPPRYELVFIPMDRSLLFRTVVRRGSPEGRSILRNAYRSYYFLTKIEQLEGIGIERDLAGLPVAFVPATLMADAAKLTGGPEVGAAKATLAQVQKIVQNIRRDNQEGVVWPVQYDAQGHPLYDLKLLSSGGSRQFDTNAITDRYARQMAMTSLADFILIGHESTGSYALIVDKTNLFMQALDAYLDAICGVVNTNAIPRLMRLNGIDPTLSPQLTHGAARGMDLTKLAAYLTAIGGAGLLDANDAELRRFVREVADLPAPAEMEDVAPEEVQEPGQDAQQQPAPNAPQTAPQPPQQAPGTQDDQLRKQAPPKTTKRAPRVTKPAA